MEFTTNMLGDIGKGLGAVGDFFGGKRLKYVLGAAALAGVASERPFHGAYEKIVNEGILGVPHGTRELGMGVAGGAIQGALGFSGSQTGQTGKIYGMGPGTVPPTLDYSGYPYSSDQYIQTPAAYPQQTTRGPDGSIVLGLYNLRA